VGSSESEESHAWGGGVHDEPFPIGDRSIALARLLAHDKYGLQVANKSPDRPTTLRMTDVLVGRRSVPSVQASGTDERDKRQETEMRPAQRRERERTGGMARSRVQSAIMHGPFIIFIPFSRLRMLPRAADCDADGAVGPASATRRASERETSQTKQAKAISSERETTQLGTPSS
jgi:hypothetical protein